MCGVYIDTIVRDYRVNILHIQLTSDLWTQLWGTVYCGSVDGQPYIADIFVLVMAGHSAVYDV